MSQSAFGDIIDTSSVNNSSQTTACILCSRLFSADNEGGEIEAIDMCMDCKFLFLEDPGTPIRDVYRRRHGSRRRRRQRGTSSESIENLFSQHFSQMIGLARTNQALLVEPDNQSLNGDNTTRISQLMSSNTTPSGSRRWRRVLSDTESDGMSSLYGESVSNTGHAGHRSYHGDSDTISYSAYGVESDASVDGHSVSVMEIDDFGIPDGGSDFETDTDIDPMHAGLYQWNSDDREGEDYEEDTEWEEVNVEENSVDSWRLGTSLRRSISSYGRTPAVNFRRTINFLESGNITNLMIPERRRAENINISARGAPPAAISFVKNLPRFIVDSENTDDLACAICKDSINAGAVVNELPCSHIYHPSCITPWLSERNSCPLCRFELPTDDKDYENRKQTSGSGGPNNIWQQELTRSSSSDLSDGAYADELDEPHGMDNAITMQSDDPTTNATAETSNRSRGRSIFHRVVSAPLVSVVGIVIVLWLGNSISSRRPSSALPVTHDQRHLSWNLDSHSSNQRVIDGRRRWWSLF